MQLTRGLFTSKVARRLLGLFVLSAILPILFTAILSFTQVRSLLEKNGREQLESLSKTYGLSIHDRLNYSDQLITQLAAQLRQGDDEYKDNLEFMTSYFDSITLYHESEATPLIDDTVLNLTLTSLETNHLKEGKPLLTTIVNEEGFGHVLLTVLVDKTDHSKGILLAKIRPLYLWGSRDTLSYNYEYCVLFNKSVILYCTDVMEPNASKQIIVGLQNSEKGTLKWVNNQETYYGDSWVLYLKHRYMSPAWTIVTSQTSNLIYSPINTFQSIFPMSILLAALLAALFSIRSIRKTTQPLESLLIGTQRITKQEFNNEVQIDSDDEFEALADSFNTMSRTLGKQFNALETLSKLDRLILSAPAPGHIIEIVIQHLSSQIRSANISISIIDDSATGEATLFINGSTAMSGELLKRFILPRQEIISLLTNKQGFSAKKDSSIAEIMFPLIDESLEAMYIIPIVYKNRLYGSINVGMYERERELDSEEKQQILALSDRISVALASSEKEEQLYRQAHFDPLTGLPNRQLLKDRLTRELMYARREDNNVAILFLDLDRFKNINDSLGHSAGDLLLQQAGTRLEKLLRDTDTVARIGGDEFTIILSNLNGPTDAGAVANELIKAMAAPFVINGSTNFVGASIGIAVFPTDGDDGDELMKKADTAMYRAKQMGRNTYAYFTEDMNSEAIERISLENDLHTALENNEFVLYYQPLINVKTNRVDSCEVLLRWKRPGYEKLVSPGMFITTAEDTGLIDSIGTWVIQTASGKFRDWMKHEHGLKRIAINVSGHQFSNPRFIDNVQSALEQSNLPRHHLELEVTESVLVHDMETSLKTLETIYNSGIGLTIDDFGTGYSSLSYLRNLPTDTLKVDRSFVMDIPHDKEATAIVHMIIELAHRLNKKVVVEGIETAEQAEAIRELGADIVQGYYFSQPLSEEDFLQFLLERNKMSA
ncbi:MAG: EAL domain-containing protein [Gammaproteobacteria bacterium]|nr:EAL domain-containing protein [Gammaproteobacteria bacterium]